MDKEKSKKIPDHAELVFKGVLHDVYQWQQEAFDGSFLTFEAIRRRNLENWKFDWLDYFYFARDCKKNGQIKFDPGEKIETVFLTFSEFLEIIERKEFRNKHLRDFVKEKGEKEFEKFLFGEK